MARVSRRLKAMFDGLAGSRAALIAYATGFYPDRRRCVDAVLTMLESGADAVEIGIPFSDPVMDGPVIQRSSGAALDAGATPAGVIDMVSEIRGRTDAPLLLMTYYNPILRMGEARFVELAADAGADGIVVPDLPTEEMVNLRRECEAAGVSTVAFCSPTTSRGRIREAAAAASGFLYCVSRLGTTGAREDLSSELPGFLARVREEAACPTAAGIGVSTPEHCGMIGGLADGVIVGSALVELVPRRGGDLTALAALTKSMSAAL